MDSEYIPLEDKIILFFKDEIAFTTEDVIKRFPDENQRTIYRAVAKLVETSRIRYANRVGRKNIYTAVGISNLPMIKNATGQIVPVSVLIKALPEMFDSNTGRFKQTEVDDTFILMCQLFVIAQEPTRADFNEAHKKLIALREFYLRMSDNVNNILRHPAMQGDLEAFKKTFASDKDAAVPTAKELMKFRRWLANKNGN